MVLPKNFREPLPFEDHPVTAFPETDIERSLRRSLAPLAIEIGHGMTDQPWIGSFVGLRDVGGPSVDLLRALGDARPLPKRLVDVWSEMQDWMSLQADRARIAPGYVLPPHVAVRISALEHLLDTLPDPTSAGMKARFAWLQHIATFDHYRTNEEDAALASRIASDFDQFMRSVQSGQRKELSPAPRTQADRRREVVSILQTQPDLSDREIARRCKVSPQTVNNWRRKLLDASKP